MRYKAREMEFLGGTLEVLVCNTRTASALTSIANCLLLTGGMRLDCRAANVAMGSFLERCISRFVFDRFKFSALPTHDTKETLQNYFDITKKLSTGLEVNHGTAEYDFFELLGFPPIHAAAFNEQVLSTLQESFEGQVGILCLDGEFNTICKHNGTIYMLIEDEGVHMNNRTAIWKTIADQKEIFVASDFSCITAHIEEKLYKCSRCSKQFCIKNNYERHVKSHVPASQAKLNFAWWNEDALAKCWDEIPDDNACSILSSSYETVEKLLGSSAKSIISKWIMSPEFRTASTEVKNVVKKLKFGNTSRKTSSDVLLDILKVASEGTFMCTNLVKGDIVFEKLDRSENTMRSMLAYFSLEVEKSLAKKLNVEKSTQSLAAMADLMDDQKASQGIRAALPLKTSTSSPQSEDLHSLSPKTSTSSTQSEATHTVSDDKDRSKDDENRKLLPEEYFPICVARKRLVRIYTLFSQVKVSALTRVGRKMAKRLLKYILKHHKNGSCWNGDWHILDIRVKGDGSTFVINKTPITATKDGIVADLQRFIVLLHPYYKTEGTRGPLYFDEFHSDAMGVPELGSHKFKVFTRFMEGHPAFMPPLARSTLIEKLFQLCDDIRKENGQLSYKALLRIDCPSWIGIRKSSVYSGVFFHKIRKNANWDPTWYGTEDGTALMPYDDNLWDLLKFLRNFIIHALDYTKVDGVQVIEDLTVLDLMMAFDRGTSITKMLLNLLYVFEKPNASFASGVHTEHQMVIVKKLMRIRKKMKSIQKETEAPVILDSVFCLGHVAFEMENIPELTSGFVARL